MKHLHLIATALIVTLLCPSLLHAETRNVSDIQELRAAVDAAKPGDRIVLADGTYRLDDKLRIRNAGMPGQPIVLTSQTLHGAVIEVDTVEGLYWNAPHWHVEGLHFRGVCADDSTCEHAIHIVESSDFGVIRHNVFEDFNAQIKGNGQQVNGVYQYPDDVLIEGNEFFDNAARQTANPVTKIDVVGGRRWIVRANFIHDFAKAEGNFVSYAAFLKGNSRDGLFERNLVACEALHTGQVRLGLSFGGGGTGPDSICEDGTCTPEHQDGIMRNNIVANCPADVAIYLNASTNTLIEHNTLYQSTGVDVRFEASTATLRDNLMMGKIRERNGGTITLEDNNLTQLGAQDFARMFVNPAALDFALLDGARIVDQGSAAAQTTDDFCGATREAARDIGAVEYLTATPCDTSTAPSITSGMMMPGEDMGGADMSGADMSGADMSGSTPDMGTSPDDMGSQAPDMGNTPGDMASRPDQGGSPSQDMSAADMGAGGSPAVDDEGCSTARNSSPAGVPTLLLLGLLAIPALLRRRKP